VDKPKGGSGPKPAATVLRKSRGELGEDLACATLAKSGVRILARNFRCKIGEIDVVGLVGDTLVFVEVRSRSRSDLGLPAESVGYKKQQKLRKIAVYYLIVADKVNAPCRFDVVSIVYGRANEAAVDWIVNAF